MSSLKELEQVVNDLTGIRKMVAVARDGTLLTHNNERGDKLGDYVAFVALTAEQLKAHLGFNGPYHMILEQTSGDRILTLLGEQIILGLDLDAHVSPAIILDRLNPVFEQLTI
ncbi:MAG: hypothetical protein OQK97_11760 [Deltaproteobacteria bacterium]|jgi:predicted regulator of Ras-like GTPase activity (Roadblock/LC7/MglB family)|nr:hypothetical protein [Deltaproteobacteria bacterium]